MYEQHGWGLDVDRSDVCMTCTIIGGEAIANDSFGRLRACIVVPDGLDEQHGEMVFKPRTGVEGVM